MLACRLVMKPRRGFGRRLRREPLDKRPAKSTAGGLDDVAVCLDAAPAARADGGHPVGEVPASSNCGAMTSRPAALM